MTSLFKIETIMYQDGGELVEERDVFINIDKITSISRLPTLTGEEVYTIVMDNGLEYYVTAETVFILMGIKDD